VTSPGAPARRRTSRSRQRQIVRIVQSAKRIAGKGEVGQRSCAQT
jgi:hypothetical protein